MNPTSNDKEFVKKNLLDSFLISLFATIIFNSSEFTVYKTKYLEFWNCTWLQPPSQHFNHLCDLSMIKSVYDKMPSMVHTRTVVILIPILILFGPIKNVYGVDLCIFFGNCNQDQQPSEPRDGIDGAIQIDNDWIQQEDSNNNQVWNKYTCLLNYHSLFRKYFNIFSSGHGPSINNVTHFLRLLIPPSPLHPFY